MVSLRKYSFKRPAQRVDVVSETVPCHTENAMDLYSGMDEDSVFTLIDAALAVSDASNDIQQYRPVYFRAVEAAKYLREPLSECMCLNLEDLHQNLRYLERLEHLEELQAIIRG